MKVGLPVSAILYGLSRGPILLYNGQEVGEPGAGVEGFGGDDSRTSIFDYWSMPELTKWVNDHKYDGGRLSDDQKRLRAGYGRLINLAGEPAVQGRNLHPVEPHQSRQSKIWPDRKRNTERALALWLSALRRRKPHNAFSSW